MPAGAMFANTLQSLGLKPQKEKSGGLEAVEEEAQPLGGAASRRRLRNVSQVAVRGLELADVRGGFFLEVAAGDAAEHLERSEEFRTRNPTWSLPCGIRRGRQHRAFEVRAVDAWSKETLWRELVDLQECEPFCQDLEALARMPTQPEGRAGS